MASNAIAPRVLEPISWTRKLSNNLMTLFAVGSSVLVIVPLFAIFAYLVMKGIGSINWAFLTQAPKPVGETGGGMGNAIVGSGVILGLASLIGIPLGIGAGIYLAEYGRNWLGNTVRFTADVLNGIPSIVVGISVYGLVVITQKHFSAVAGGVALGIMMIPTVSRGDGRDAAAGAAHDSRGGLGTGSFPVAGNAVSDAEDGIRRSDYGSHAGFCARSR